jgi:hypothetical protein
MNDVALKAMLDLVTQARERDCDAALTQARAEAARIIRAAQREARERLHRNVLEVRATMRREIAQAEAALDTARRQYRSRCDFALLERSEPLLSEVLAARWRDPETRRRWVERLALRARAVLPDEPWEIAHPADWPGAERDALATRLPRPPRFVATPGLAAGLRFCARGACLDGTLDGLTADREAIHGRLLAELRP